MITDLAAAALAALWLAGEPFALLAPILLSASDRRALDRGEVVSRTIDGESGQVGVFAVSRIDVAAESLVATARAIEDLKRSSYVTAIKRFSNPPRIEDLDQLVLPPKELQAALACRPSSCTMKLLPDEIDQLVAEAARPGADRAARVQQAFRAIVLARALAYVRNGVSDLAAMTRRPATPGTESFLYWSMESYGSGKPIVLITHINIIPPASAADPAIVIGKQIFASHYINEGLALTAITTDAETGARFLIYRNNTGVDLLGGLFGPIKRRVLESRLRRDVPDVIARLRQRLERNGVARPVH